MGSIVPIDVTPLLDEEVRTFLDQGLINEDKPLHLLVYGTLLDRNRRRAFLGRDDLTHPIRVILHGFRRTTLAIDGDKFPNLVHNSTSTVYSAEVVQVFIPELLFLNRYETDAYTLRKVQPNYYPGPFTFAYFGRETWREWEESQIPRRRKAT